MGTNNPKVSAYVPQAIKDRLKQFTKENDLSESQAVTEILAQYFGMTEVFGKSYQGTAGVTLGRIEALEQGFASFAESVDCRLQELGESIKKLSELRVDLGRQEEAVIDTQQIISQGTEVPANGEDIQLELHQVKEVDIASPLDELPTKVEQTGENNEPIFVLLSEPLSDSLEEIKPIQGIKLSKLRFSRSEATVSGIKQKKSIEEFTEWTRQSDPDGIAWKFVESPSKGYVPADELSSELKSRLLRWIKENIK